MPELCLQDCQDLCDGDLNKAIKFKILINKMRDSKLEWKDDKTQEDMITVLKNLYTTYICEIARISIAVHKAEDGCLGGNEDQLKLFSD